MWTNEAAGPQQISVSRGELAIVKLNDLGANRKLRVSTSESAIRGALWVLLIGSGAVVMAFTFLFAPGISLFMPVPWQ